MPTHARGVVDAMGAKLAADLIVEAQLDGLDHAGGVHGKLRSTGVRFRWDHLAAVEFSDPRNLPDVGGKMLSDGTVRGTWLKLSATDLDAMRLALPDPQTRVRAAAASGAAQRPARFRTDRRAWISRWPRADLRPASQHVDRWPRHRQIRDPRGHPLRSARSVILSSQACLDNDATERAISRGEPERFGLLKNEG
jgi:hypothetical protein